MFENVGMFPFSAMFSRGAMLPRCTGDDDSGDAEFIGIGSDFDSRAATRSLSSGSDTLSCRSAV